DQTPDRRTRRPRTDRRERARRRRSARPGGGDGRRRGAGLPHRSAELRGSEGTPGRRRPAGRRRDGRRPRALHAQRGVDQQPHPCPGPQTARPAREGRRGGRRPGHGRARRSRARRGRPRGRRRQLAEDVQLPGQGRRLPAAAADREHRGWGQRHGPRPRRDRQAVGGGRRARRRLRARHLPRLGGGLGPGHRGGGRPGDHRPRRPGPPQQQPRPGGLQPRPARAPGRRRDPARAPGRGGPGGRLPRRPRDARGRRGARRGDRAPTRRPRL
ncbi:MAG: Endonuclease IV, partial [uncultured Blastococcus sp.]